MPILWVYIMFSVLVGGVFVVGGGVGIHSAQETDSFLFRVHFAAASLG